MSSLWDVVIAGNGLNLLMPALSEWSDQQERGAVFHLWPRNHDDSLFMVTPVISGMVNHLDPESLMNVISDVHKNHWQLFPVTIVLRNEYDGHDQLHQVWRLNSDGTWR